MIQRKVCAWSFLLLSVFSGSGAALKAGVVWYSNDHEGWTAAAGKIYTIDFNTLPDGSPSIAGTLITPDFNYTPQGATFSSPVTIPYIAGNSVSGFGLEVDSSPNLDRNWIIGELVSPSYAIGMSFPSFGILSVFDEQDQLISTFWGGNFGTAHLGVISDVPIASFTMDRNSSFSILSSFHQGVVPEPAVLTLIIAGSLCLLCGRRGRRSWRSPTESPGVQS